MITVAEPNNYKAVRKQKICAHHPKANVSNVHS